MILTWRKDPKKRDYTTHVFTTGCWLWKGSKNQDGYGLFKTIPPNLVREGKKGKAFQKSYTVHQMALRSKMTGNMKPKWDASHLCHENACFHPSHIVHEPHDVS
jgi:hypothetical protein